MKNVEDFYSEVDEQITLNEKIYKRERFNRKIKIKEEHIGFFEKEFYSRDDDVSEIRKLISFGEEIKTKDIELAKKIVNQRKIKKKLGIYNFENYILEISTLPLDNKKIFLIRNNNEDRIE